VFAEDLFHLGQIIQPLDDVLGGFAVEQSLVDFLPDVVRQPRDFTSSRHIAGSWFVVVAFQIHACYCVPAHKAAHLQRTGA
jgi:hypothetical protein